MIEELSIKNMALIKEVIINFSKNLNILSGETGSGKSIIIDSINFVFGGKIGGDFIRSGEDFAIVSILISISSFSSIEFLKENGIPIETDNKILITRKIWITGKSSIKINGKSVTISLLREFSSYFIDIYGQFEHNYLLNEKEHINLLDKFCNSSLEQLKIGLSDSIENYKDINTKILKMENETKNIDTLAEEIEELQTLDLKDNEEDEILKKIKYLNNFRELSEGINKSISMIYPEGGAIDKIAKATKFLKNISNIMENTEVIENLENILLQLQDINHVLKHTVTDFDQKKLNALEDRLATIHTVKRKYKKEIKDVILYFENLKTLLDEIENKAFIIENLKNERKFFKEKIVYFCAEISKLRWEAKIFLESKIIESLKDLGMKNVDFQISIEKKETFSINGNDIIKFMITANLGEPLKPLSKIASGGEMSRIMLSLKIVLSSGNNVETFIFDEIDTGVSGRTAQRVADKLYKFSKNKQIICITHLPQIASMADRHFLIEKVNYNNETITNINKLKNNEITEEIARLIGGTKITENTIKAAKEMKELATLWKV
ncbi:MAG: DNA repair protein RecN [Defluviitaleaceae bacterium]|nr:DNA repair protein RecN [Defluviitaleaceae bacterium]